MMCAITKATTNVLHRIGFENTFVQNIVLVIRRKFSEKNYDKNQRHIVGNNSGKETPRKIYDTSMISNTQKNICRERKLNDRKSITTYDKWYVTGKYASQNEKIKSVPEIINDSRKEENQKKQNQGIWFYDKGLIYPKWYQIWSVQGDIHSCNFQRRKIE